MTALEEFGLAEEPWATPLESVDQDEVDALFDMLDWRTPDPAPKLESKVDAPKQAPLRAMSKVDADLKRVSANLGEVILTWARLHVGTVFRMADLVEHVTIDLGSKCSHESPSRILRLLQRRGHLRYTLLSRSESLYRLDWVMS